MAELKDTFFILAAIGALSGAIGVVMLKNAFYSVLALVVHLLSLAVLFLELQAQFVAAAQVVVYAGAVMVLYVFVVAYVGGQDQPVHEPGPAMRILAPLCGLGVAVVLCVALLGSGLKAIDSGGPHLHVVYGSPAQIGSLLLTRFLLPFEVASYLLLVAAVGAVMLARRRKGMLVEPERISVRRALGTGTMAEAVGGRLGDGHAPEGDRVTLERDPTAPSSTGGGW